MQDVWDRKQERDSDTTLPAGKTIGENIGIDCFELEGVEYLVNVDYFSNYWELDKLDKNTSSVVINKLKVHF